MEISFNVKGTHYPIGRVVLPFHSMNVALSDTNTETGFGFPTRGLVEVSGNTGIGKSTFVTDISSRLSQALGDLEISYLDLEGQSENTIYNTLKNSGYSADSFNWVTSKSGKKEDNTDEALLGLLEDSLYNEPAHIGILDSVAAISSIAEREGNIGDANMGRRAFPMAQFTRRVIRALRTIETPTNVFLLNHLYEKIGAIGPAKQYTSPGGNVKNNLEALNIEMKVPYVEYISGGDSKKEARWEGSWVLEGKVKKNREGMKDPIFQVFIYGGQGIHVGMSAVIDCLASKIATIKSGKIVMDGYDYGLLSKAIENKKDDREFFIPFQNALKVEKVDSVSENENS